jgi:hypothetical protein
MNGQTRGSTPELTSADLAAIDAAGFGTLGVSNARAWVHRRRQIARLLPVRVKDERRSTLGARLTQY